MRSRPKALTVVLALLACGLLIGLASIVTIISREGVEGLFRRKRDAVEKVAPDAVPLVDEIEKGVRGK